MWSAWVWSWALKAWLYWELKSCSWISTALPQTCFVLNSSTPSNCSFLGVMKWKSIWVLCPGCWGCSVPDCAVSWVFHTLDLLSPLPFSILQARGVSVCLFNTDWACPYCSPLIYLTIFNMYNSFSTNTLLHISWAVSTPMQRDCLLVPLGTAFIWTTVWKTKRSRV